MFKQNLAYLVGCAFLELYGEASTRYVLTTKNKETFILVKCKLCIIYFFVCVKMYVNDYIYDTYIGFILMSADLVWLFVYISNCRM